MGNLHSTSVGKNVRDLILFNTAIDSKLRGCDLASLKANDMMHGGKIVKRIIIT